jgi:hypothetical protein
MECESLLSLFPSKLASNPFGSALIRRFGESARNGEASFAGKSESKLSHSKLFLHHPRGGGRKGGSPYM